jgi:hypothetical protein
VEVETHNPHFTIVIPNALACARERNLATLTVTDADFGTYWNGYRKNELLRAES